MQTLSSNLFTHNKEAKTFTAFASDLPGCLIPHMFDMESARTGAIAEVQFTRVEHDRDGDVVCWMYKFTAPELEGYMIRIYND